MPDGPDAATHPLSARAIGCLRSANIRTVGELAERSAEDLLAIPNFGSESLKRTEAFLDELGLSLSKTPYAPPERGIAYPWIEPRVEEKLRSAGVWEGSTPGRTAPGVRLRDLVRAPGLVDAEELDGMLSALAVRALLPKPKGMNEFLGLLAACGAARDALAASRLRIAHGPKDAVNGEDAALDATGRLLDVAKVEIHHGTLHERALLDWPPLAVANERLTHEERTLLGLLEILVRVPGMGLSAEKVRRAEEGIVSYRTLDEELRALLRDVVALDGRKRLVMLGSFSWEGRLTLQTLGDRFGVSRERIRQLKVDVARGLESR